MEAAPKGRAEPSAVRLLALDVDGVLTDGSILLSDDGSEIKRFNIRDGLGIRVWMRLGLETAIVTGRTGEAVRHRARELGITRVVQGQLSKAASMRELEAQTGVALSEMAFIGDDWIDLPAMRIVGYPIAVADADARVLAAAAHVTAKPGGRGAVREAIEHLLAAKGLMDSALSQFE